MPLPLSAGCDECPFPDPGHGPTLRLEPLAQMMRRMCCCGLWSESAVLRPGEGPLAMHGILRLVVESRILVAVVRYWDPEGRVVMVLFVPTHGLELRLFSNSCWPCSASAPQAQLNIQTMTVDRPTASFGTLSISKSSLMASTTCLIAWIRSSRLVSDGYYSAIISKASGL